MDAGFALAHESSVHDFQTGDTVGRSPGLECLEVRQLRGFGRHDQLAAPIVRYAVRGAEGVEPFGSLDAQGGLHRARGIVDPGVDNA